MRLESKLQLHNPVQQSLFSQNRIADRKAPITSLLLAFYQDVVAQFYPPRRRE